VWLGNEEINKEKGDILQNISPQEASKKTSNWGTTAGTCVA